MASMRSCCLILIFATIAVFQPGGEAQLGDINISGTVPCSTGTGAGAGSAPGFPNATVLLKCGSSVITGTTTAIDGAFKLQLTAVVNALLSALVNDCRLSVVTPLSACNKLLPSSGTLRAPLQLLASGLPGGIGNIGAGDFSYGP